MNNEKYQNQMDQIRSKRDQAVEAIRSNNDLTEGAKSDKLKFVKEQAETAMQALKEQRRQEMAVKRDSLYSEFMTLRHRDTESAADKSLKQNLYQQAIERAEKTADGEELADLLLTAKQTGNQTLAQAIGFVAFETGFYDVAKSALTADSEARAKKFDQLLELKTALEAPTPRQMMEEGSIFAI